MQGYGKSLNFFLAPAGGHPVDGWERPQGDGLRSHPAGIVLGMACWHLGGNTQPAHALPGLVRMGTIRLLHPWPEHLERTQELMLKDDRMDAADDSAAKGCQLCFLQASRSFACSREWSKP